MRFRGEAEASGPAYRYPGRIDVLQVLPLIFTGAGVLKTTCLCSELQRSAAAMQATDEHKKMLGSELGGEVSFVVLHSLNSSFELQQLQPA